MKPGDIVTTPHGEGLVIRREGTEGVLRTRILVKVSLVSGHPLQALQERNGGYLAYFQSELKKVQKNCTN